MAVEILIKVTDAYSKGFKDAEKQMKSLQKTGEQLSKIGGIMTLGITVPLAALGGVAVKAASDMNESLSKTTVVFEKQADAVLNWSKTAATSFGMSRQEALEAASSFGNMFRSMQLDGAVSEKMSTNLVQLAADLASLNNANPADMLEKLRSGLVGQAEPLRPLGVLLSEAAVKQKALTMGLAESADALTDQDKVMARYQLILEQTKTSQGDFARTSDGLANQQRILSAQFKDAAAMLGQNLLPVAVQAAQTLNGMLTSFNAMSPATQKMIIGIAGLAAAAGPILVVAGNALKLYATFQQVQAGITAARAAAVALGGTTPLVTGFGAALKGVGAAAAPIAVVTAALFALVKLVQMDEFKQVAALVWGKIGATVTGDATRGAMATAAAYKTLGGGQAGGQDTGNAIRGVVPGFATGGAFTVGGFGGRDSQLVQFMATPGEPVVVGNPGGRSGLTIPVVYAPTFSTASQQEFEANLRPIINSIIRTNPGR